MSKRLQVLLPDREMESVIRLAKAEQLTVGEYVRRALREVETGRPAKDPGAKLAAIRQAASFAFPTSDIEQMNREIARGYSA